MTSTDRRLSPASTATSSTTTNPRVCRKHGVPLEFEPHANTMLSEGYWYCPVCAEAIERKAAEDEARRRRELLWRGIPPHYRGADLSHFDAASIAPVLKWVAEPKGFVYIHGSCGVGKTHLACAVQKKLNADGWYGKLVFSSEMFLSLYKSFGRNSAVMEDEILNRYAPEKEADIAIFDDVGAQKISDYTVDAWYKIVDRRYRGNYPTIFTTNLKPGELSATLGDRTASRIISGVKIEIKGEDRRVKKKHWTEKYD